MCATLNRRTENLSEEKLTSGAFLFLFSFCNVQRGCSCFIGF